jgi:hypothetical protein
LTGPPLGRRFQNPQYKTFLAKEQLPLAFLVVILKDTDRLPIVMRPALGPCRVLKNSLKLAGRSKSSRCKAAGRRKPERTGSYVRISDDRERSRWTFSAAC